MNADTSPLRFSREPLISLEQSERIYEQARRVLAEVGLEVHDAPVLNSLQAAGLRVSGTRIFFDPRLLDEHVEEMRRRLMSEQEAAPRADDGIIRLSTSSYGLFVHDNESGRVVPYDTPRLIEMTRFIDSFHGQEVYGAPPGIPTDVHPDLQPVAQYYIAARYARQGATPVDPTSPRTAPFMLDMAEAMGNPMRSLPVYLPTPLRLGGESLAVVLACLDRIEHIWVGSMPSAGTSAPLQPFGAFVLAAAEVLGGMVAVKLLTDKPVSCAVNIFPANMREGSMVFGSPENALLQMLGDDFNRFLGHSAVGSAYSGPDNLHDMAKLPDCQSAAEKAAILMAGAGLGARWFTGAGMLSLDEIFSPEQLLVDCEIRDWVQRAVHGVELGEAAVPDWVEEIRAGLNGGFMNRDSSLDHYREQAWYPKWFQRGAIGPWNEKGQPHLLDALRIEVKRRIAAHRYELDGERRAAIETIYRAAQHTILG